MVFTTFTFLLFLLAVFFLHWSVKSRNYQNAVLLISSYVFYGWWDARFCLLMLASSLIDWYSVKKMVQSSNKKGRRLFLTISIVSNLSFLGFFKYYNFFVDSASTLLSTLGFATDSPTLSILLPVGISFYTFQTMSYSIDVYRGNAQPGKSFLAYLTYVSFFPQLVAGPIERASRLLPQFAKARVFHDAQATDGCRQILWGFFKKMVIADNLAPYVDQVYSSPEFFTPPQLILATVFFAFQIYADFSGYSDIAVGLGKLFGINLMRNFAFPYFSQSIDEFWRRWNISLSTWFRDYVYIPLGGNKGTSHLIVRNILITFVLSGLWHGASWNFVIWGLLNGVALLPTFFLRDSSKRIKSTDPPGGNSLVPSPGFLAAVLVTFSYTCLAWVFFRAMTLEDSFFILQRILTWEAVSDPYYTTTLHAAVSLPTMLIFIMGLIVIEWVTKKHEHPLQFGKLPEYITFPIYTGIIWFILYWGTHTSGQFIYFQF